MKNRRETILSYLERNSIKHSVVGLTVNLNCPINARHTATWEISTGWMSCPTCEKIWRYTHAFQVLSEMLSKSKTSELSQYLGWRGIMKGEIQPWLIPKWAEEFHSYLLKDSSKLNEIDKLLGFDSEIIEKFRIGWSPEDFYPEKKWRYSNCLTIPVAQLGSSWSFIYFYGKDLLAKGFFYKYRTLGLPVDYWTLYPQKTEEIKETENPIDAIKMAIKSIENNKETKVVFRQR